jgi:hypothetical protein
VSIGLTKPLLSLINCLWRAIGYGHVFLAQQDIWMHDRPLNYTCVFILRRKAIVIIQQAFSLLSYEYSTSDGCSRVLASDGVGKSGRAGGL